ncbi:hypothetical protein LCGC14_3029310 [marine sediment metagenome]|uniref:Uncharacterized protein n=1 Tax=marine sediment metagenome TaxID=412755 RepID=A0A0F8WTB4_9ZZZZ
MMKSLFKTQAVFVPGMSKVHKGLYSFLVHPDDQVIFKAKMAQLLKDQLDKKHKKHPNLILSVSVYHPPRTLKQNDMYRAMLRAMCTQKESAAYGSDPDNLHEGVLARAAISYGYPTITVAGIKVPERSHKTMTTQMNLLMEVARVIAGEIGADVSHIGAEE